MTTAENLNRIIQAKADIKTAIENKGVAVGDVTIDSYAEKIGKIPQDVSFNGLDFTVIGYDMTLTRELNDEFNADIQYSLQKYNEWDENNTSATYLFKEDKKLVYAPFINTQNVEDMYNMFSNCTNLTTVPLIDTSKVRDMQGMFNGCTNLTAVPLFDTSNAKKMASMFTNCTNLTTVPLFDTQNVTGMNSMFENCANLTTVPLFNTQNVTGMASMFYDCKNLTTVPHFNTQNVTGMNNMFYGCKNLTTIPQFDTQNVTNINSLFYNCPALESLPLLECGKVLDKSMVFGYSELKNLTTLGGFKDWKVEWSDNYGLAQCPNLTYESVMNVINNLYDFRANGDETTTKKIKFHANSLALLSDDDKAIATNKGWILS